MNYPYEIHITVDLEKSNKTLIQFQETCERFRVKHISLWLGAGIPNDVMTSSKYFGTVAGVNENANGLVERVQSCGFVVIRKKIETVPWNPICDEIGEGQYFECHYEIAVDNVKAAHINNFLLPDMYPSRNVSKSGLDSVTIRSCESKEKAATLFVKRLQDVGKYGIIKEHQIEFVLSDSNLAHDDKWINHWRKNGEVCC